jgi:hypothetical protein
MNLNWNQRQSDNNDKEIEEAEAQAHLNNDSRPIQVHTFSMHHRVKFKNIFSFST